MKLLGIDGHTILSGKYRPIRSLVNACIRKGISLERANLSGANLSGVNFFEANLFGANFFEVNLSGANLSGVNFSGANLFGANFFEANLSGANLSGANLSGVNFSGANLFGANFSGANLWYTKGNDKEIRNLNLPRYPVICCKKYIKIGCQKYTYEEWLSFSDDAIERMDVGALEWWNCYKKEIIAFYLKN